jgi:TonB-linked SusC/RagA family outer membrane protein
MQLIALCKAFLPKKGRDVFSPQSWLIMKLTIILLTAACLQVSARSFSQTITMSEKNAQLTKVFAQIKKQAGFAFWYEDRLLALAKPVNIHVKNESLETVLQLCFKDQSFTYKVVGKTVVIKEKEEPSKKEQAVPRPPMEITGKVTDPNGKPIQGVSVVRVGENKGVSTDANGNYTISVLDNSVLRFSYIGYASVETSVKNKASIDIVLIPSVSALNDIVVVGYGTQQRKNVTGSISSVSSKNFESQSLAGLDQAMAGQAAGVQVSQTSGTPGGGVTVRVRGTGSISAGNEPLYVVDGFPIEGAYNRDLNPLSTLNPNDIESIQILKDASSAAIYGSRGSNGVVIVTTKRGKSGKTKITFDSYYGVQNVAHKIDMLNASEYATFNTEARNNAWVDAGGKASDPNSVRPDRFKIPPMFADPASLGKGTDWQDAVFQSAPMQNYQITASGGSDNTQFLVSGNYFKQEGIVINTNFERYSFRFNLDTKVSDKLKLGFNLAPSYTKNDVLPVEDQVFTGGILGSALAMPPTIPVYNPDGSFTSQLATSIYNTGVIDNPVAIASKIKGGTTGFRTLANMYAEYEIVKDLKFKTLFGADYFDARTSFFSPSDLGRAGVMAPVIPIGNASSSRDFTWLNENTLTYDKTIREKHRINILAGFTSQKAHSENAYLSGINFPNDLVQTLNAATISSGGTGVSEWSLLSYLGRINYSYESKYLATATIRRDGSSRFGEDNKWGLFPSGSIGWNVSRENFLANSKIVSDLKLRASYGLAGNNTIGNYSSIGLLSSNRYVFGAGTGTVVNGLQPFSISNTELGWEVMRQLDIGMDLSVLKNRLALTVDYYDKTTSDLLLNVPVPASTGFANALQNIGKVSNKGWEFALSSKNFVHAFKWNTDFNISFDKNKVLALGPKGDPIIVTSPSFSPQTHITKIGMPLASFYGYDAIGVFRDQADVNATPHVAGAKPGDLKFRDVNGDGLISSLDQTIIGSHQPKYTFGMTNNFAYKNFELTVLIDGAQGFQVLNGGRRNIGLVSGSYSRSDVLGRWQSPENPGDGHTPRANTAPTGGNVSFVSTLLIEDASFVRVRNINLRYHFPKSFVEHGPFQHASAFFSVQNAFTFTNYRGYNPEQSLNGASSLTPGVDFNGYPIARVMTFGINVTFK